MLTARRAGAIDSGTGVAGVRGALRLDEPMARHTSWRAGGRARRFFVPADAEDLQCFLRGTPSEEPLLWVGLGSNLLVRDGGLRGTVISTARLNACPYIDKWPSERAIAERAIVAQAGAPCARIARLAAELGLIGAEFLAGIPGTLGGALCMNAGAFGGETWELVGSVETIDRQGGRRRRVAPRTSRSAIARYARRRTSGTWPRSWCSRPIRRAGGSIASRRSWAGAPRPNPWASRAADRCSRTRPATTPRG